MSILIIVTRKVGNPSPCVPHESTQLANNREHAAEIIAGLLQNPSVAAISIANL